MEHSYGLEDTIALSQAEGILLTTITTTNPVNIKSVNDKLLEHRSETSASLNEVVAAHCLICNIHLTTNAEGSCNVFTRMKAIRNVEESRVSVFEKMGQILNRSLCSIRLHSEVICSKCFSLVVDYDTLEYKLELIRDDIILKFDETAYHHQPEGKVDNQNQPPNYEENNKENSGSQTENNNVVVLINSNGETKVITSKNNPVSDNSNGVGKVKVKKKKKVTKSVNKRYSCPMCGKNFRAFSHRVEHMLIHIGEKPFVCEECKRAFRTRSALKIHWMKHTGERPYLCKCGKSFTDKYYYEEHSRIHTGERPYSCSFCSRSFARKKDMTVHMKTHTGDKPHKCSACPKSFAVKSRLDRHLRIHTGIKPHTCQYCSKQFSRKDDYQVHVRVHTGEKPFHCGFCNRSFANQSNCLAHVRTHTGTKPYKCSACDLGFDRKSKVEQHIVEAHKIQAVHEIQFVQEATLPTHQINTTTTTHDCGSQNLEIHAQFPDVSAAESSSQTPTNDSEASILSTSGVTLSELHTLPVQSIQGLPVGQVAQVTWTSGDQVQTSTTTVPIPVTGTYVNIGPGAYVNIVN